MLNKKQQPMTRLNKQLRGWIWVLTIGFILFSSHLSGQGWEFIEEDNTEVPSDIIAPSQGGYLSIGTNILTGTGPVLKLDRIDLEGNVIFSKQYNVVTPIGGSANAYSVNEYESTNDFLVTGAQIGYLKIRSNGELDWHFNVTNLNLPASDRVISSSIVNEVEAFITTEGSNNSISNVSLARIDANGILSWVRTFEEPYDIRPVSHITTNDGGCVILCEYEDGAEVGMAIIRTDSNGNELPTRKYPTFIVNRKTLTQGPSGAMYFIDNSTGNNRIYQIDSNLNETIWKVINQDVIFEASELLVDIDGNFVLTGHRVEDNLSKPTLMKMDGNGNDIWTNLHQVEDGATIISTTIDKDNQIVSAGQYLLDQPGIFATAYRISVDTNGDIFDNFITGNVYSDRNNLCEFDGDDFPLPNWLIKAEGELDYYGVTDELGNYTIPVPVGTYTVSISSPSVYYEPCVDSYNIEATDTPTSFVLDFGMEPIEECPSLQVEVSVPFLRFCNEQVYYVDYCNYGTEAASDVIVEVVLDPLLTFVSGNPITPIFQSNNTFSFNVPGTLDVGECGQFTFTTQLTCEEDYVGSTVCVDASIFPLCEEPTLPTPHLVVNGFCDGDSIQFDIINIGGTELLTERNWIVIEDNIILNFGTVVGLASQESVSIRIAADDGATYNLLIEQVLPFVPNQLGDPFASGVVEGCVGFPSEPYTYNNYLDDDGVLNTAEECNEIISSFDPNDKQVIPNGVGDEHFTLPNVSMEYKVRFQNTGTDTAFLVVIRDTISEHLDLTTFVPGASSHPYRYEILNNGYLKFTFENILLPDSTTNEPASNGFVKYTIRQQRDLEPGTVITNCAGIYFDFNSPVITNCTWNTIQPFENWVVDSEDFIDTESNVKVFPNPFDKYVNFEIESDAIELLYNEKNFILYNANGQVIANKNFTQNTYQFDRKELPPGMYFYEMRQDGNTFSAGKLIIQ